MGSIFRSEEMQLSQLILHTDSAYMCIAQLGELGVVQIRDTTPEVNAFQRKFVDEVRRCDEMERKLRYIENELQKDAFPIFEPDEVPKAPPPREMLDLESNLDKLENELREVNFSLEQMKKSFMELTELKMVLRRAQLFFEVGSYEVNMNLGGGDEMLVEISESRDSRDRRSGYIEMVPQSDDFDVGFRQGHTTSATYSSHHVDFVAGVIIRERTLPFERMLWRACRGNVFLRYSDLESIEDPATGELLDKCMFIIFFQGPQLRSRVENICDGFHATLYACPDTQEKRQAMLLDVTSRREDLQVVLNRTLEHRARVLETAAQSLRKWFYKVHKMKSVYHVLNLFNLDVTTKCMVGECWSAVSDLDAVQIALRRGMELSNSSLQPILNRLHTTEKPPTFHRVNKFTGAFQNIVDAYGVAKYREVNPALFTVITFPFLFAVMFGDAGHGAIMFLVGLFLVLWEKKCLTKKIKGELWDTFFGGRYIILLMGVFSIYTGLIYNDIFSKTANIFGSSWFPLFDNRTLERGEALQLNPDTHIGADAASTGMFAGFPYPFGLDPVWQVSHNMIMFTNSLKMKMSIILGVLHMLFGILLGAFNYRFFKNSLSIYCDLIPEVLFMLSIFGYLVFMIFYKWIVFCSKDAATAPSLLISLINMMKFDYEKKDDTQSLYNGQPIVQSILVVIALLCVPWMLLAKPLILHRRHKFHRTLAAIRSAGFGELGNTGNSVVGAGTSDYVPFRSEASPKFEPPSDPEVPHASGGHGDSEEFVFGEVMVYQAIHTIEFCLGCISNTASYLRLWALSLAHAQLSEVLWEMVMMNGLKVNGYYGGIILFFVFAAWAGLTIGVLVLMEGLSAFLHALRLHWVEFQNKFYEGSGYLFEPFSFANIEKLSVE
ncbi:V-type proton ATPase subunit a isoform [Echinococcus granulosus]|uniref:V-type proton ATPase subunit a n=1 Tax=Echinococcus granulosus TaxID=6210 RepID=U6J7M1_ECHGR|nr:V-type proton ATPase subunit a isoform [Echinococcus granulosus]EUB63307.1 V-type proton ATPase subunit a isoform [Echinococcus granulosus]CDS20082.1 V type proton ATPase 116 kDa subunit a [Echinococcus granulosus]